VDYQIDLIAQGLIDGSIYALIAVGMTMVFGLLRVLHVAHAGVYTFGAFVAVIVYNAFGSFALALVCAGLACGALGVLIYFAFYQRLLDRSPEVVLIASIGLFIAMQEAYRILFGANGVSYTPAPLRQTLALGPVHLSAGELMMLVFTVAVFLLLGVLARQTRFGVAVRATVTDPQMARSSGVSVTQVRVFVFFLGSVLAGIAGTFSGVLNNFVEPTMGAVPLFKAMAIIIIGGFGDVRGTLVAALFIGLVEAYGTVYLTHILDRDAIAFAAMLAILLARPRGLFEG
jgi:branched-chain amino acid transport system permease protein